MTNENVITIHMGSDMLEKIGILARKNQWTEEFTVVQMVNSGLIVHKMVVNPK